jgi:Holliday junction resolvase RusA-like endonuclease
MKMIISGSTPSKKNSRINTRSGRSFPSKNYSSWNKGAILEMQIQFKGYEVTEYPISLRMVFYWKDKRRHDIDNSVASIQDTLKDAGVILDDDFNHINKITGEYGGVDRDNPRCEIYLDE